MKNFNYLPEMFEIKLKKREKKEKKPPKIPDSIPINLDF